MNRYPMLFTLLCFVTALSGGQAAAQEKRLKKSDLPAAVQKAVDAATKGAQVVGYERENEDGEIHYEVETMVNGHSRDITFAADGTVLEVEEAVTLDALPAAVRAGLQHLAGASAITKVEAISKHGTLVGYEAQVRRDGKRSEIAVGPDGKPLAHEP